MKQLDLWDTSLGRMIQDALLGMSPGPTARRRLLTEAGLSARRVRYAYHPGWISASVARSLRTRRISVNGPQHGHFLTAQNLRFAW